MEKEHILFEGPYDLPARSSNGRIMRMKTLECWKALI